jgi:mRNA interferase RelE/StbE
MKALDYTTAAARQLRKLPAPTRERLIARLHAYAASGKGDVVKMAGQEGARLRVGDHRAVFVEPADAISVRAVGHRRDIYR